MKKNFYLLVVYSFSVLGVIFTTQHANWNRVHYGKSIFEFSKIPILNENALILVIGDQGAFCAPFLSKNNKKIQFVSVLPWATEARKQKIKEIIKQHNGAIYVLRGRSDIFDLTLSRLGIKIDFSKITGNSSNNQVFFTEILNNLENYRLYLIPNNNLDSAINKKIKDDFTTQITSLSDWCIDFRDEHIFEKGWSRRAEKQRQSDGAISSCEFYLDGKVEKISTMTILGNPFGKQSATIFLNGRQVFSGDISKNGVKEITVPPHTLRTKIDGVNYLDFRWSNPTKHKTVFLSFALEKIIFNEINTTPSRSVFFKGVKSKSDFFETTSISGLRKDRGDTAFRSIGSESSIILKAKPVASNVIIELELSPFLKNRTLDSQNFVVYLNTKKMQSISLKKREKIQLKFPMELWNSEVNKNNLITLSFSWKNATSPKALGMNNDVRLLACSFHKFDITLAPP